MRKLRLWGLAVLFMAALGQTARAEGIEVWTTHSLDKAFPESLKPAGAPESIALQAARNETEDAQVLVRVPEKTLIARASFTLPDLAGPDGASLGKDNLSAHWVWYTYVLNNPKANTDPSSYLRKAPAFFPDGFVEAATIRIRDNWTQPLWVSVRVPKGTPPGAYTGTLGLDLVDDKGAANHFDVPLSVEVWPFTLPDEPSLHHTEWFSVGGLADYYRLEPWSEPHWTWIGRVAEDMGRHRQDMILTPFSGLVTLSKDATGALAMDFTRLDRWIETFRRAGVTWIEGAHVAGRAGNWESEIVWARFPITGPDGAPIDTSPAAMSEEAFEPYMQAFLQLIHAHLKEKGWADRYFQHVADEPIPQNEASWKHRAERVREWLPGVPTIDAVMSEGLEGYIDIRVPQIQHVGPDVQRHPNEALWSYVCLYPQGQYPNRFLDYPSIRNRILFWLSWSLNLEGFLHWGYNYWQPWDKVPVPVDVSPWLDATGGSIYVADRQPLPAGDPFVVYPGRNGICGSIRWEVVRKGMEDYEYLRLLQDAVSAAAPGAEGLTEARALLDGVRNELAAAPDRHTRDDRVLLETRRRAGELIAQLRPEK